MFPDHDIQQAISLGIAKINVGAEGRQAWFDGIKEAFEENPQERFPHVIYRRGSVSHKELVKRKMRLFGSSGKIRSIHHG